MEGGQEVRSDEHKNLVVSLFTSAVGINCGWTGIDGGVLVLMVVGTGIDGGVYVCVCVVVCVEGVGVCMAVRQHPPPAPPHPHGSYPYPE